MNVRREESIGGVEHMDCLKCERGKTHHIWTIRRFMHHGLI
jgi:hypothetical protein